MKVVAPGTFVFAPNGTGLVTGWTFADSSGLRGAEQRRAAIAAVLQYIARAEGIRLIEASDAAPDERVPLDVERLAQDVIAMARWTPQQGEGA